MSVIVLYGAAELLHKSKKCYMVIGTLCLTGRVLELVEILKEWGWGKRVKRKTEKWTTVSPFVVL